MSRSPQPLLNGFHPDSRAVYPLMDLLGDLGMPVLVHSGHLMFSLPWSIAELAAKFPRVPVILGHMGYGDIVSINAALQVACDLGNVYLETSGQPMGSKIAEAARKIGADRILYGSDGPFHHPDVERLKVIRSGLADSQLPLVLHGNAGRLFGFEKDQL